MNSTAMDIAGFLETGLWIRGTNLFVGLFPDLPVQAICVYDTMGTSPDRYQDPMKAPTEFCYIRYGVSHCAECRVCLTFDYQSDSGGGWGRCAIRYHKPTGGYITIRQR